MPAPGTDDTVRRSLVLAGGGLKAAAQAGALQVWLDEATINGKPITFDHGDGTSGGCFNLAMWCQGMTGVEIADNWRTFRPLSSLSLNLPGILLGPLASSLFTMKRMRDEQFDRWRLDWTTIRKSARRATFNMFDFTHQQPLVVENSVMTADLMVAALSIPVWFPPVRHRGSTVLDGVFVSNANVLHAAEHGADEIWVIWTVRTDGRWRRGWINQYFHIVEETSNGRLALDLERIQRNNELHDAGNPCEYDKHVTVKMLRLDVDLHYLLNFRARKFSKAVDNGARRAREWCRREGYLQ